jgi:DHA2 family multidrug resistance protein
LCCRWDTWLAASSGGAIFQFANITGPALGGLLFTFPLAQFAPHTRLEGAGIVYVFTLGTLGWFLALVATLNARPGRMEHRDLSLKVLLAGFQYVRQAQLLIGSLSLDLFVVLLGGATALMPIFMQSLLGYPAFQSGMAMMPRGVGSMLSMILISRLVSKFGNRLMILFGFLGLGVTMFIFSGYNLNIAETNITWPLFFNGLVMGFTFVPLTTLTMANIPQSDIQQASGIFSLLRNIGASVGISLMFTMQARMAQVHQSVLVSHVNPYGQQFQLWAERMGALFHNPAATFGLAYRGILVQSAMLSFLDCFRWLGYAALVVIPLIALFKGSRHIKTQAELHLAE